MDQKVNELGVMTDWLIAIGTILLAIIAALQDRIRSKFWRPKLDCKTHLYPPDCHRTISRSPTLEFYSFYYLFEIWNTGNISAKNVEVLIVDVLKKEGNIYNRINLFMPDNLKWGTLSYVLNSQLIHPRYCNYISPDTYKHCNLGHIHDPRHRRGLPNEDNPALPVGDDESVFCFDVHFQSNNLYYIIGPGTYKVKIKVGCENAKTITKNYKLVLTGRWFEDETRMLNEGLSIEEI